MPTVYAKKPNPSSGPRTRSVNDGSRAPYHSAMILVLGLLRSLKRSGDNVEQLDVSPDSENTFIGIDVCRI